MCLGSLSPPPFPINQQSANQFTGTFPYAQDANGPSSDGGWSNVGQLSVFMLNDNQLSGTIPDSFIEASGESLLKYVHFLLSSGSGHPTRVLTLTRAHLFLYLILYR